MTELLDLDAARVQLLAGLEPLPDVVEVALDAAAGRHLAAECRAVVNVPPFANSAMDGYAVSSSDPAVGRGRSLSVARRIMAGDPPGPPVPAGACARIFTGAPMPPGADCVIIQEDVEVHADGRVTLHESPRPDANVRHAGEDVLQGDVVAGPGDRLHAGRLGLLAAAGIGRVAVHPRPRVIILTTGDELRPPGAALEPGQIHDGNGVMLAALARGCDADVLRVELVGDDPETLRHALLTAAAEADALICSGGVSVGEADHVRGILEAEGQVDFWRLALKPGKPFAYGQLHARPFFGLPGNPVSALVTFLLLVRPALLKLAGASDLDSPTLPAVLAAPAKKRPGRRDFQRGWFSMETAGPLQVRPLAHQGSHMLSTLTQGNCLIDLPRDSENPAAGTPVRIIPLGRL